jgi:hypothetical protein
MGNCNIEFFFVLKTTCSTQGMGSALLPCYKGFDGS